MTRILPCLLLTLAASPGFACPVEPMQHAAGPDQAAAAYRGIVAAGADCSGAERDWAAREATLRYVTAARQSLAAGGTVAGALALLDAGLEFGRPWQALAFRGDLRQLMRTGRAPDYAAASEDYQLALNAIVAGNPLVEPVPAPVIAMIWRKAEQTWSLAGRPVTMPVTRSGQLGGLALPQVRSFRPVARMVPIQFVFDSQQTTVAGTRDAGDLVRMLDRQGRPAIILIGHTDPKGPPGRADAYNMDLSLRRANAVKDFLVSRGYAPERIRVEGHGKRDRPQIVDEDNYAPEEIDQILRRVEVRLP